MESCLSDYINAKYFLENSLKFEDRVLGALYADDNGTIALQLLNSLTNNLLKNYTSIDDLFSDIEMMQKLGNIESTVVQNTIALIARNVFTFSKVSDFIGKQWLCSSPSIIKAYIGNSYVVQIDYNSYNFTLADYNHDKDNTFSFILTPGSNVYARIKMDSGTSSWASTDMRTYLNNDFYNVIESDVKNNIVTVDKINTTRYGGVSPTQDKVWLLSYTEVGMELADIDAEGTPYPIFTDNQSRIYYHDTSDAAATTWWLRSVSDWTTFRHISNLGSLGEDSSSTELGVVPGFCI